MADKVDHTHGDTGTKPPQDLNFTSGGKPDAEEFDWFWSEVPAVINNHANTLDSIDSDGDGTVDAADTAAKVKGNDIDSDGDGIVNEADSISDLDSVSNIYKLESGEVTLNADQDIIVLSNHTFNSPNNVLTCSISLSAVTTDFYEGSYYGYGGSTQSEIPHQDSLDRGAFGYSITLLNGEHEVQIGNASNSERDINYVVYEIEP